MEKHFYRKNSYEKGARWRVGTCISIPLFGAPWIANGMSLAYDNPTFAPLAHLKVKDIIDQSDKVWNTPFIFNLFDPNTTQLILSTPLHPLVDEDKLIWKAEKNGMYSVRVVHIDFVLVR